MPDTLYFLNIVNSACKDKSFVPLYIEDWNQSFQYQGQKQGDSGKTGLEIGTIILR